MLFTGGLFGEFNCRHINHFGELLLFIGWSTFSGSLINLIIPVAIYYNLMSFQLPFLDYYLYLRYDNRRQRYRFSHWEQRTNLLFPTMKITGWTSR